METGESQNCIVDYPEEPMMQMKFKAVWQFSGEFPLLREAVVFFFKFRLSTD